MSSPDKTDHTALQAEILHKALAGLGTKEKDVIDMLARHSVEQRQAISTAYKATYKTDLISDITKDTSGSFLKVLKALCRLPEVNDAKTLHYAVKGLGTDEETILEVLCTRTNEELNKLSNAYFSLFRTTLVSDLKKDTSGDFLEVLLALLSGVRNETGKVDIAQAKLDAVALHRAGPGKWGTDLKTFIEIFVTRGYAQLQEMCRHYEKLAGMDVEKSIKQEMSGDLALSFATLVRLIQNKEEYFAERLHKAVKGLGNDACLVRIFVSRREKDLKGIGRAYQKLYGKSLTDMVAEESSSDYKNTLLAMLDSAV